MVTELTYYDNNKKEHILKLEEIDYFKRQNKIVLRNCGITDCISIEDYIANDGYFAIAKVLKEKTQDDVIKIDIYPAEKVLDSTGCGDIYGGGFLYGYTRGYSLEKCGKIASFLASQIISVPGVQLELLDFNKIKDFIQKEIIDK